MLGPEAAEILRLYATLGASEQFAEAFLKAYVKESSLLLKKAARRFLGPHPVDLELAHLASEDILRRRLPETLLQVGTPRRCNMFSAYVFGTVFPSVEQVNDSGSVTSLIRQRGISSLSVSRVAYLVLVQAMLDLDRPSEAARLVEAISEYGDMRIKVTFRVDKEKAVITRNSKMLFVKF